MRSAFLAQAVIGLIAAATTDAASLQQRAATCAKLPEGSGPKANPDTVPAFLAQPAISNAANRASTPKAYVKQFGNLQGASIITNQYLGVSFLKSYDVDACAAKCNAVRSCNSFNVYYERDPSQEPGSGNSGCANPCSTTNIKCALFAGSVSAASATNKGQFRNKFQVAIAGSNGYTNALFLVSQARDEIGQISNSAQPYCSSILGYTTPVVTATIFTTSTPLATTSTTAIQTNLGTTTITVESIATVTNTLSTTLTEVLPTTTVAVETDSTTTTILVPTTTILPSTTTITTVTLTFPTTTFTTTTTTASAGAFSKREDPPMTTINGVVALALPPVPTIAGAQKRAIVVPSVLSKYPGSIITSACSLAVSPVTKTRTVTRTSISTVGTVTATQITSTTTATTATELTSTTISTFVSTTEIGTVTTNPVVTSIATTITTLTEVQVPTITVTDVTSETATVSTSPIVTATTTTTTIAPVCTATTYNLRVVGGPRDGQYLATVDPPSSTVTTYAFVTYVTDLASANAWSLNSADRVFSSAANIFSWVTRNNNLYYVLSMSASSQATYGIPFVFCSVQRSDAVAGVPGATGQLVCRRDDGVATNLVTCETGGNNLLQTTDVGAAGNGCQAVTIAAIPVNSAC